ncbi:MAG: hypothetical protein IJE09_04455 [Oscillospiraceae bacterium]|nr:hypothetical protein [Oscillospiraceae bacterium]
MADIKNIITGTINNLVGKVKEVADNADVKGTVKDIYEQGSSKVKAYSQIAKLSLELTGDKDELKKLYTEIGRLYFEETKEPDEFFAPLFEQAQEVFTRISDKEALIEALKAAECECDEECCAEECCCEGEECCCEGDIEVEVCEFEEVVEATEAACCAEEAPAEETPVEEAPAEEAPVEEAPAEEVQE